MSEFIVEIFYIENMIDDLKLYLYITFIIVDSRLGRNKIKARKLINLRLTE